MAGVAGRVALVTGAGSDGGIGFATARLLKEATDHLNAETVYEGGAPVVELDEMHLRQLRALGYSIE